MPTNTIITQIGPPIIQNTPLPAPTIVIINNVKEVIVASPPKTLSLGLVLAISVLIALLILLIFLIISRRIKNKDSINKTLKYKILLIRVPRSDETEIKVAEQMFASFSGITKKPGFFKSFLTGREGISFEIIALPEYIGFYVYTPAKWANLIENQILGAYQGIEVAEMPEPNIFAAGSFVSCAYLELASEDYAPLKSYQQYQGQSGQIADPLTSITAAVGHLKHGEGASIQFMISPSAKNWQKRGQSYVSRVETNNSNPEKTKISVSQDKLKAISEKCSKPGFDVSIRMVTSALSTHEANDLMHTVLSSFQQFNNPGINQIKFKKVTKPPTIRSFMSDFIYRKFPLGKTMTLNTEELATMFHFPNKDVETPNLEKLFSKKTPPPQNMPNTGLWLGTSIYRGKKKKIFMQRDDRRRHMYVIGQTGGGKSMFLKNMIMQDIYNGEGIAFIDPHGSTASDIIDRIPAHRAEDVIYFDPSDGERPFGLNIIASKNETERHMVVNSFLGLMKKMFDPNDQGIVGPRFERAVRMAMLTVMVDPKNTLVEVLRAIADEKFALSFLPQVHDDEVRRYWTVEMANTDKFHKSEILGWVTSKFDRFVTNKLIRNIIGQSDVSLDFRKAMDEKKIIIINLAKGVIGEENASFLGLVIVPMILRAALSREDIAEEDRQDFFMYVDEFQNFASEEFAQILSEARKYRLSLITANQYMSQMIEKVRDAIFGNVGTLTVLRTGAQDAEYLEKEFKPIFTAEDLINLENMNAYVKLLINGVRTPGFSMSTFYNQSQLYPKNAKVSQLVKQLSRMRYGRDVNLVAEDIIQRSTIAGDSAGPNSNIESSPPIF